MTRVAILIMRPKAPGDPNTQTTIWYGNGRVSGYHVLDDLLEQPGMPTTDAELARALHLRGYGDVPLGVLDEDSDRTLDWLFSEVDQVVVFGANAKGGDRGDQQDGALLRLHGTGDLTDAHKYKVRAQRQAEPEGRPAAGPAWELTMAESVNQRRCDCCGVPNGGHALGCLDYWPPQEPPSPQPFHGTLGEEVPLAFLARFITSPSTLELWQDPQRPYALLLYHRGFSATQVHPNGVQMAEHDILVPLLPADIRRLRDLCDRVLRALPASPAAVRECEAKVWYGDAVLQAESGTGRVRGDQES